MNNHSSPPTTCEDLPRKNFPQENSNDCGVCATLREMNTTAGLGDMFGFGPGVFSAVHRAKLVYFAKGLALGVKTKPGAYIREFTAGAAANTLAPAGL